MCKWGKDKLGWRQEHIRTVLLSGQPMTLKQIAVETAMLGIEASCPSSLDAIAFLSAQDGIALEDGNYPASRKHWWRTDTSKALRKLEARHMVRKVDRGTYIWIF